MREAIRDIQRGGEDRWGSALERIAKAHDETDVFLLIAFTRPPR